MHDPVSRRDLLKLGGAAAVLGLGLAPTLAQAPTAAAPPPAGRKRSIRLAHLTDLHIQPEARADQGVAMCLRHMMAQKDKPDLVLTGGDLIMDSMYTDEARAKLQWELWAKVLKDECPLPLRHCMGNHDIWGWGKTQSKTSGGEPLWGKRWFCENYELEKPYYSFEQAGWRFIVLDSVFPYEEGYMGRLDDEQFEWLGGVLAATPSTQHVLVLTHIPILHAGTLVVDAKASTENGMTLSRGAVMMDYHRTVDLFDKRKQVKAVLSGHIHMVDRIDYNGVSYLGGGAVCGPWWQGQAKFAERMKERAQPGDPPRPPRCVEGYNLVDLYDDGTVERQYVTYGWEAASQ